jgi:hypothetical protein
MFDKALEKVKEIKTNYDVQKRAEKEDNLNVKAQELQEKEERLKQLKLDLERQTKKMDQMAFALASKARQPLYVFIACVCTGVVLSGVLWNYYEFVPRSEPIFSRDTEDLSAETNSKTSNESNVEGQKRADANVNSAVSSTGQTMSFEDCLGVIRRTARELSVTPISVVETDILRVARFRTTEGSVLVSCSKPDRKMILTRSPN